MPIQGCNEFTCVSLAVRTPKRRLTSRGVGRPSGKQIVNRLALRPEGNTLITSGKKSIRPVNRSPRRKPSWIGKDHIGRQVIGFTPQSVGHPRTKNRKTIQSKTGVGLKRRRCMVGRVRYHRSDDGQFVRHAGEMWKQVGNPQATLAMLTKLPVVFSQ